MLKIAHAKFAPGQLVQHKFLQYRGLIVDLDPEFDYHVLEITNAAAPTQNLHEPWYHVLVEGERYAAYIAEDNLELAEDVRVRDFEHPLFADFFQKQSGVITSLRHMN